MSVFVMGVFFLVIFSHPGIKDIITITRQTIIIPTIPKNEPIAALL